MSEQDVLDAIAALDEKLDDIQAKTDTIGALEVIVTSPVGTGGDINIFAGDDMDADLDTQIDIDITEGAILNVSWTNAVCELYSEAFDDSVTGTISDLALGKRLRFELTGAETALLDAGVYDYAVRVTFPGTPDQTVTVACGSLTVTEPVA